MLGFNSVRELFVATLAMTSGLVTNAIGSKNIPAQGIVVPWGLSSADNAEQNSIVFPGAHPATLTKNGVEIDGDEALHRIDADMSDFDRLTHRTILTYGGYTETFEPVVGSSLVPDLNHSLFSLNRSDSVFDVYIPDLQSSPRLYVIKGSINIDKLVFNSQKEDSLKVVSGLVFPNGGDIFGSPKEDYADIDEKVRNGYTMIDVMNKKNDRLVVKLLLDIDIVSCEEMIRSQDFEIKLQADLDIGKLYNKFANSIAASFSKNQELEVEKKKNSYLHNELRIYKNPDTIAGICDLTGAEDPKSGVVNPELTSKLVNDYDNVQGI